MKGNSNASPEITETPSVLLVTEASNTQREMDPGAEASREIEKVTTDAAKSAERGRGRTAESTGSGLCGSW